MASIPNQTASLPLLATKLFIPALHTELVPRPRLVNRFQQGLDRKLTTVTAPAGSGKTTLVAGWHASTGREMPLAWFSVDTGENDPVRFLLYITAAIQTIHPDIGHSVMDSLHSSQPAPPGYLLAQLLNEIGELPKPFVLVLDDLHLITNPAIHQQLVFLLDHLPPEMRLVITSRTDPPLPLARLRANVQISEFQASDLRFSTEEVAQLFNRVMQLGLDEQAVAALAEQTEGWAAGLMLAGISLQQQGIVAAFISSFAGSNRYIFDYLAEEVLMWQPPELQEFLLQTSVLSRMNASLCDAVTGRNDGQKSLELIDTANLFLIALDDVRRWYRYHHLFGGFLAEQLRQQQPELVPELHRRASRWFAAEGSMTEAIEHALQGNDYEYASELIAGAGTSAGPSAGMLMVLSGQLRTVLEWIDAFPTEVVEADSPLSGVLAWGLILSGDLDGAQPVLDRIERWLESGQIDADIRREFTGQVALARATIARLQGNIPDTLRYGELAAEYLQAGERSGYGASQNHLAFARMMRGNLGEARRLLEEAMPVVDQYNSPLVRADLRYVLSMVCISEGRLSEAVEICDELFAQSAGVDQLGLEAASVILAGVHRERNDLQEAERLALRGLEIASRVGLIHTYTMASIEMARIKLAQGNLDAVDALVDEVDLAVHRASMASYASHSLNELRIRSAIAAGDPGKAQRFALPQPIEAPDSLDFLRGKELLANALLLTATGQLDEVLALLEQMEWHLTVNGVRGLLPETLLLQAIAFDAQGKPDEALGALARSLEIAEPEGYRSVYMNAGEPVPRLIRQLLEAGNWERFAGPRNISQRYVLNLLDASGQGPAAGQGLVEPLTDRELEVLQLLADGKTNQTVADELFVATGTVKTHTHNIYQKLGVRNRTQAINRARELEIIK